MNEASPRSPEIITTELIAASGYDNIPKRPYRSSQDSVMADDVLGIYAVADGVGGELCGERASELACSAFYRHVQENSDTLRNPETPDEEVKSIIKAGIDSAIIDAFIAESEDPQNPLPANAATTFTAAVRLANNRIGVIHSGDSAAFLLKKGYPIQKLTAEQAKEHEVYNAIAINPIHKIRKKTLLPDEVFIVQLQPGNRLLLCSDGLIGDTALQRTPDQKIEKVLAAALTPSQAAMDLARLPDKLEAEGLAFKNYQAKNDDRGIVTVFFSNPDGSETQDNAPKLIDEIIAERPEYEQSYLWAFYELSITSDKSAAAFETITPRDPDHAAQIINQWKTRNVTAKDIVANLKQSIKSKTSSAAAVQQLNYALNFGKSNRKTRERDLNILEIAYRYLIESYIPDDANDAEAHAIVKGRLNTVRSILHYHEN